MHKQTFIIKLTNIIAISKKIAAKYWSNVFYRINSPCTQPDFGYNWSHICS